MLEVSVYREYNNIIIMEINGEYKMNGLKTIDFLFWLISMLILIMFIGFGTKRKKIYAEKTIKYKNNMPMLIRLLGISFAFQYIPLLLFVVIVIPYMRIDDEVAKKNLLFIMLFVFVPIYIEVHRFLFQESQNYKRIISFIKGSFCLVTAVISVMEIIFLKSDRWMIGGGLAISLAIMNGIDNIIETVKKNE